MSAYSGPQGRGARRRLREVKRDEAEARNALTPPDRRKAARTPEGRLLRAIFADSSET